MGRAQGEALAPSARRRRLDCAAFSDRPLDWELVELLAAEKCPRGLAGRYQVVSGAARSCDWGNPLSEAQYWTLEEIRHDLECGDSWLAKLDSDDAALLATMAVYLDKARTPSLLDEVSWATSQTEFAHFLLKGQVPVALFFVSRQTMFDGCHCRPDLGPCRCAEMLSEIDSWLTVEMVESQTRECGAAEALTRYVATRDYRGEPLVLDAYSAKAGRSYADVWQLERFGHGSEGDGRFLMRV